MQCAGRVPVRRARPDPPRSPPTCAVPRWAELGLERVAPAGRGPAAGRAAAGGLAPRRRDRRGRPGAARAPTRPGLLYRVARALDEAGADVRAARISTLGADVVDAFYLVGAWSDADRPGAGQRRRTHREPRDRAGRLAAVRARYPRRGRVIRARDTDIGHSRMSAVFDTLSDRLYGIFTKLRGKGRLSDADIDATAREIRLALLEADVALPVVKAFIAALKERARGRRGLAGAQPGPAGHQDRARGAGRRSSAARPAGSSSPSTRRP